MSSADSLPAEIAAAVAQSIFAETSPANQHALFRGGMLVQLPAGYRIGDEPHKESRVMLVISGSFRMFYTDESGKQLTVRYINTGEIMGLVAAVGGHFPLEIEALEDASGWVVSGAQIQSVAKEHAELAWQIAQECARRLAGVFHELTSVAFGTIRERLIHHLLKLAETGRTSADDPERVAVRASQQELADAVGTSREVIARSLRELRERKLVQSDPATKQLVLNPQGLRALLEPT